MQVESLIRSVLTCGVAALGLALPAVAQSVHDFRRSYELALEGRGSARLEVIPSRPTVVEEGDCHALAVRLTIGGESWAGDGQGVGDELQADLRREAARASGPGLGGALQGLGAAAGAPLPEALRVELGDGAGTGRLLGAGLPAQGLAFSARRAPLPIDGAAWQRLSAAEKQAGLWVVAREHAWPAGGLPELGTQEALNGHRLRTLRRVVTELPHLIAAFRDRSDVRAPRWKLRHPFGSTACATFEPAPGSPYTGALAAPALALVRLTINVDAPDAWNPGIGLKLLVDGQESVNALASAFYDPTAPGVDTGLFAHTLESRNKVGRLALDHLGAVAPDGSAVGAPRVPTLLRFVPATGLPREGTGDFRDMLAALPAGTVIYRLVDQDGVAVGTLRTMTPFVASDSEDRLLHFAHHGKPIKGEGTGQGAEDPRYDGQ